MRVIPQKSCLKAKPPEKRLIFLVGPTAVGKTDTAVYLAKKINGEIISCDSMQVYKGMDILTSKPGLKARAKVAHHLIDTVAVSVNYNVTRYRRDALRAIKEIIEKGKIPIFAGGTGLYMSVVIDGIFKAVPQDSLIRKKLYKELENYGNRKLYARLLKVDRLAALKIHPNDARRLIRALEVYESTGKPISELQKQRIGLGEEFDIRIFCLNMERELLYKRIDQRVDKMFAQGLIKEVKAILKKKPAKTARYALGIREIKGYLKGDYDLEEAKRLIKRNTRHYAKRQLTWFRKDKRIEWINVKPGDTPKHIAERVRRLL